MKLPEGTIALHGTEITMAFYNRKDAERAFDLLETASAPHKEKRMRNIKEYPVDAEEAAAILITDAAGFPKDLIGDIRPMAFKIVAAFILKNKDAFDRFAKNEV